jgi:hypothetical protein
VSLHANLIRVEGLVVPIAPRFSGRMTSRISEANRAQIIAALKANPNASQVARQMGDISVWLVFAIAKEAKIALRRGGKTKVSAEQHAQIIEALKADPNASAVARKIGGISSRTVARMAEKANIELTESQLSRRRAALQTRTATNQHAAEQKTLPGADRQGS